ncbi:hypothetical protein [Streptomyces sp. NPDC007905]|uniref:hypothetical protein n=1 Tax=Streptomyces sp. NPDC007905 TaxID=3364788 RepID=UPI0036EAF80C
MRDEHNGHNPALAELRKKLSDGLAKRGLNQTELARRAGRGRTTVWEAFQPDGPLPSAQTVAALAKALKLPVEELLALQREAAGNGGGGQPPGPGRLIGQWEPHDLEVHPAGHGKVVDGLGAPGTRALPGYVRRDHDRVLADAVRDAAAGRSRMVVLVGTSSTGKTRACWEAVQPLADRGWRLWHPSDPTRAEAALEDLHRVQPCTVVWLNEAQHYLGDRAAGEHIAAAVRDVLLSAERGPVLVLGTLWPKYARRYTALPAPGGEDPHSRVRELLSGRTVTVPDSFDAPALAAATALAEGGDQLLADALTRARTDGRITQDLAGAPELLNRYRHASPPAKALLEAAMDARRLGVGLHLPQAFLTDAAVDYLRQSDYDELTDDWAEAAYAELAEPVHGKQAPLRRTTPRSPRRPPAPSAAAAPLVPQPSGPVFRLADYLEQHGRTIRKALCPPASFWHAAHTHLTHPDDLDNLAEAAANRHRLQWAHHLRHRAADHGSANALYDLAWAREQGGDRQGAEGLFRKAADHGSAAALHRLAWAREKAGDRQGADTLALQALDHGGAHALHRLAWAREKAGDREGAEALARQAVDHGHPALLHLVMFREESGDREGAEALARQTVDHSILDPLYSLAETREDAGDQEGANDLYQQAADHGNGYAMHSLALSRELAGDLKGAEDLYWQAFDHGDPAGLRSLMLMRVKSDDREGAEALARQALEHGDPDVLYLLAQLQRWVADRNRWRAEAEALARLAVDHGIDSSGGAILEKLWPHGLDPDGTPTPPWQ